MRIVRFTVCLFAATAIAASLQAQTGTDPGIPDTVRVDSVSAFVTGIGIVPVTFVNDENLTSVEVTLTEGSPQVTIDSFSFAGGRLDSAAFAREAHIDDDSSTITILALAFGTPISSGRGLLGKLYLSYSQTITPQGVPIDSTVWMEGPKLHTTSMFAAGTSRSFKPQFIPGFLNIMESPASFDSIWVSNVDGNAGAPVAVDVYAYNERPVVQVSLALDYGSSDLTLDSVSFVGTRSESAPSKTVQPQTSVHQVYTLIEFTESNPLAPGSGVAARLHFTIAPSTPEGTITIDSTTVGVGYKTQYILTLNDGGIPLVPLFIAGGVNVSPSTDVEDITDNSGLPKEFRLGQNYPNPFNPSTNIELSLPRAGHVEIDVFNILGRRVRKLLDRELPAGIERIVFDGRSDQGTMLASGVYFYRVTAGEFKDTKKMLLVK